MALGFLKSLFAGGPANSAYNFLNLGRFLSMNMVVEGLASRLGQTSDSASTREIKWFLLKNAGRLWVRLH